MKKNLNREDWERLIRETFPAQILENKSYRIYPTGSAYISPEKYKDIDVLLYAPRMAGLLKHAPTILVENGWDSQHDPAYGNDGDCNGSEFVSLRSPINNINVIYSDDLNFAMKFLVCGEAAKGMHLSNREDRVKLFSSILYGTAGEISMLELFDEHRLNYSASDSGHEPPSTVLYNSLEQQLLISKRKP